ncbi:putative berberine/berberine, FAD-binding domain, PCMH-type, FAD-binding, type PCMH, subdomain 2 [Septoria linicola]|nr:putative berberine/berberine, FAD-binding domain, PCMH-type, FAD-binding, type PCMH, subdomain 2 [Septoria linicola]
MISSLDLTAAIAFLLPLTLATPLTGRAAASISSITEAQWQALNSSVSGRLHNASPVAKPCYSFYNGVLSPPDLQQCKAVQDGYTSEDSIVSNFGGYQYPNWASCQAKAQGCQLDFTATANPAYYAPPKNCFQGSVASYYIDIREVSDIQAALKFADQTGVPLVIKNSGHDFKGRSSAPNALALWTHNVQPSIKLTRGFTPEGCSSPAGDAVTLGAGQGWAGVYEFAEANDITVVGGSSRTVGPVGGWISGGGHGALSNTLGLGVDNVLEMKAVLPDGRFITANRCQNQDIFFALRGGGGSTFGVNWSMTTRAHPKLQLEVAYIRFAAANTSTIRRFIEICTELGDRWADDGWGGYIAPGALSSLVSGMIMMTPKLTHEQAVASMKPLTDYVASLGVVPLDNSINTEPSFYTAYQKYIGPNQEKVGVGIAMGSKFVNRGMLKTSAGQKTIADAIEKSAKMVVPIAGRSGVDFRSLTYGAPFQILVTAPSSYETDGSSSVTPAWYGPNGAAWHVCLGQGIANDADTATIQAAFRNANQATQVLRDAVGSPGAYQNEADTFEPEPEASYWGDNYSRLLSIKKALDPKNLLTCWQCIGWDKSDPRYGCYPQI